MKKQISLKKMLYPYLRSYNRHISRSAVKRWPLDRVLANIHPGDLGYLLRRFRDDKRLLPAQREALERAAAVTQYKHF